MTPTLVFDIETIPDTDGLRLLYDLPQDTSAEDVANNADSDAASDTAHGPSPATAPTRPKLTAGWSAAGGKLALVRGEKYKNKTFRATSFPQQPPTV